MNLGFSSPVQGRHEAGQRFADVQGALRDRARRREHLCSEILTEPAWDILLELYAYDLLGRRPPVAELTDRINVPSTTSLRWIKMLEAEGLVRREIGSGSAAGVCVYLAPKGLQAMEGYFFSSRSNRERSGLRGM
jgi:DNA-binding MarR family transcriptional regulator